MDQESGKHSDETDQGSESNSITQIEIKKPVALLRSRNYLDLDNEARDTQRQKLNISAFSPTTSDLHNNSNGPQEAQSRESLPDANKQEYESGYEYPELVDTQNQYSQVPELDPQPSGGNAHPDLVASLEPGQRLADECRMDILRNLLKIERHKNEQRRKNNTVMQSYLKQLQGDYLRLQQDQLNFLELSNKIKVQRDSQIETLNATLTERESLIEKLRQQLAALDETKVREEFNSLLEKQRQLGQTERQQLKDQVATLEKQIISEEENYSQSLHKLQMKLDHQTERHKEELDKLRDVEVKLKLEIETLLNEPQNLVIRSLREDKQKLEAQVVELNLTLEQDQCKYESLKKRVELLVGEQEQLELDSERKICQLESQSSEQKAQMNELRSKLNDKDETIQIMQFNLTRSEKRIRSLISGMRQKEAIYKRMLEEMESNKELEFTKTMNNLRSCERKIIELENQLTVKQNQIVKLNLEQETKFESMRNDRDQRINKLAGERDKYEHELKISEIKLAEEFELGDQLRQTIEQLRAEVDQFKQESRKLSLELTRTEAILFNKQQELDEFTAIVRSTEQQVEGCQMLELDLEDSRRQIKRLEETIDELRRDNEKLALKLKFSETKLSDLNGQIKKEHAKFLKEFERKLELIKRNQGEQEKLGIKYKKCGHKLKKYCNNLRQQHEIN